MRIVFMGTPEFAVASLEALIAAGQEVVGVVTAPDRPAGRGRKLKASAVKDAGLKHNIPVLQPQKLKAPEFLEALEALNADLFVVVAFRMLPEVVWSMPRFGTFNLHGSLLPEYRGAAPIHWAVINGETQTGVTTFFIDEKIDTGAIIANKSMPIAPDETTGEVHDRMMELGASLVAETVAAIESGTVQAKPQPKEKTFKPAPKLHAENTRIDWSLPGAYIYNKVRGLNPFPAAWTEFVLEDEVISAKIYKVAYEPAEHNYTTGSVVCDKKSIRIAIEDGWINLLEIKLSGKRKMAAADLLNGFSFPLDSKVQ
ncbi:methionyl-tRNA formyltransferase [Gilvibacter sediminis]|uniref:methionyl-tRNA formyltransferase n=1 Tax=Gilvibacter sediminis TaxID=379071 RepID=UPI0023507DD7|nr:methionyl-tRNA formyltransferase [Gilvibacter sediminis]MDC7998178.1 methionyl-tRNA formyltransferase [Gilvibacter sediminis]